MSKTVCTFCGHSFPSGDLEKGKAVVLLGKTYCKKCMDRAVRQKTRNPKETTKLSIPSAH